MRQKRVPLSRKSTSKPQGGSKTCTLRQKVRQKHVPSARKPGARRRTKGQTPSCIFRIRRIPNPRDKDIVLVNTPARRHKLRCLFLSVLIIARASASRLADLRALAPSALVATSYSESVILSRIEARLRRDFIIFRLGYPIQTPLFDPEQTIVSSQHPLRFLEAPPTNVHCSF